MTTATPNSAQGFNIVPFRLNKPQARALTIMANETWVLAGRGTGKTIGIIAPWMLHKVQHMPRSSGGIVGQTFKDLETKILEPLFQAFSEQGMVEGQHFLFGKKPPESWVKPYTVPITYETVLSFANGTCAHLLSLHKKGSANAKSLQWIVGDEAKFLDEVRLTAEVFPVLRGHQRHFGSSPWYGAKLFVTDKLSPSIHWILKKRELVNVKLVDAIIFYQLQVNELRMQMAKVGKRQAYNYQRRIDQLEVALTAMRRHCVAVIEASAYDNVENLTPSYFENMRRSLTPYEYEVAIENKDPSRVENGFYPDRKEEHLYYSHEDDDAFQPLGIALDWQASLSPIVVCQVSDRVHPGLQTLNFLNCFYTKYPEGRKEAVRQFTEHYRHRPCKVVNFFYDHTAVAKQNGAKKFYQEIVDWLEEADWQVNCIYMSHAPNQSVKYSRLKSFFQSQGPFPYPIRIHKDRCSVMVLAMDQTGTKETEEGTKKDKSSERDPKFPQEQATHFPDTFDQLAWAVNELKLWPTYQESDARAGVVFR